MRKQSRGTKITKKRVIAAVCLAIALLLGGGTAADWKPLVQMVMGDSISRGEGLLPVVRVVDGDTIVVKLNGEDEKVRLIGINTPESVHPDKSKNTQEGKKASDYTKELLEGQSVSLEFDTQERDKYGRLLAYVYLEDGTFFNEKLILDGYAELATYPPNVKYVDVFEAAQKKVNQEREHE